MMQRIGKVLARGRRGQCYITRRTSAGLASSTHDAARAI